MGGAEAEERIDALAESLAALRAGEHGIRRAQCKQRIMEKGGALYA